IHESLGWALLRLGEIDASIDSLKTALSLGSTSAQTYTLLAKAHRELGNLEDAIRCLERAMAIDPKNAEAAFTLINSKRTLCQWRNLAQLEHRAIGLLGNSSPLATAPFALLSVRDEPSLHLEAARQCAIGFAEKVRTSMAERPRAAREKIRLGY